MARDRGSNNGNENNQGRRRERSEAAPRRKSGILGKILCLFLGFIMGIVGTIGGIGGLGYYAVTQVQIKDAVGTVNDLTGLNIDYTQYVNEKYGDLSVFGMVEDVINTAGKLQDGTGSLDTLNDISPMVGTSVQSLIDTVSEYGITIEYDGLMSTPFAELGDFLSNTVNNIEVARLVETVTQNPVEGILAMICYGELGEDYIILEDGTVQMLGDSTSVTIGSLTNADELSKRLNNLTFSSLIGALGEIDTSDPIIRTLVYGEKGVDYVVNADGSISPLPKTYQLSVEAGAQVFTSPDGVKFTVVEEGVWKDADNNVIQLREDSSAYKYDVFDSTQTLICSLKYLRADDDGEYYQVYVSDVAQTRKGPYISDVLGGDLLSIVGTLPLGEILKLNGSSDSIMLAFAYGEKDVDYKIENNKIIPINPPLTINDLIGGGKGIEMIKDISLATVLGIESPLQSGVDSLMMILAYGEQDTHYELIDANNDGTYEDWRWLNDEKGKPYSERTIGYLMSGETDSLFNSLTLETLMNINSGSAPLMRGLAYGNEGTHYVLVDGNPNDADPTRNVVKMLPKRYYITGSQVYDEEHILIGTVKAEKESGIFEVHVVGDDNDEYIKANPDTGYDVFPSLEAAQSYPTGKDTRLHHTKTKLSDLRGETAEIYIERIELAAALGIDIFGENADPLMIQIAYGTEDVHYKLDRTNKQITWQKDNDPNSETYGLYFHARTIHDMKDTHTLLESIYLDTVLELNYQSPAIMLSLAYGNDYEIVDETVSYDRNNRRTIGHLMGGNSNDLINGIEMRKIIVADDNAMMNYILYNMTHPDENSDDYKVRTLGEFMNNSQGIIDGMMGVLTVHEALGDDATQDGILFSLRDATLSTMDEAINDLTLVKVLGENATQDGVLYCLRDTKLRDLDEVSKDLTLQALLGESVSTHPILKNISDATLDTLEEKLEDLTIQQIMDKSPTDSIYNYEKFGDEWATAVDGKKVVWKNENNRWEFEDGTEAPSPLKGTWKYLLIDNETGKERLYTLEQMNSAMDNVADNMQSATLYDLLDDGIISVSPDEGGNSVLDEDIIYSLTIGKVCDPYMNGTVQKMKLGELTVSETIDYLSKMIKVVSHFAS